MIYRRVIPLAAGVAIFAGGVFSLSQTGVGSRLNDHGLKNYSFIDPKRFDLINVSILMRHGARTPNYYIHSKYDTPDWQSGLGYVDLLPDLCYEVDLTELPSKKLITEESVQDEYIQHINGKCFVGQLTLLGQEQSLAFGRELRRIYMNSAKIINEDFDENEILCRSTKFPRTYYTLKGVLSGLYGVDSFDMCRKPIIYTMPIVSDFLYPNQSVCSVFGPFISAGNAEVSKEKEIIKMKCILKKILGVDYLAFSSPGDIKTKEQSKCQKNKPSQKVQDDNVSIYAVRDDLISRQVHNFEVPSAFSTIYPEVNRLASLEILCEHLGGSQEWEERIAIVVSPVINFIKSNMKIVATTFLASQDTKKPLVASLKDAITKKQKTMKMQLLSCHDTTLIPLLLCLRIYDGQWPSFMSNLIIELYKERNSDNLFTRVLYCGETQKLKLSDGSCTETPKVKSSDGLCTGKDDYEKLGLLPYAEFEKILNKYSFPDDKYSSACDKILKLFNSGKPVIKEQYA